MNRSAESTASRAGRVCCYDDAHGCKAGDSFAGMRAAVLNRFVTEIRKLLAFWTHVQQSSKNQAG